MYTAHVVVLAMRLSDPLCRFSSHFAESGEFQKIELLLLSGLSFLVF